MSHDEEQQEKRGFKVDDRRRFSEDGAARPDRAESDAPGDSVGGTAPAGERSVAEAPPAEPPSLDLNFSTFVISLSTQALAHLGEIEDPINRQVSVDLDAAQQLIDILGILKDKTKGNLDQAEAGLLDSVLYDLRLRFVERVRVQSPKA
jgi:Domain of unknown function (DUF1844)